MPQPRPVDIMLADMRSQPYPAEALRRMAPSTKAAPPQKQMQAFSGQGRTLGESSAAPPADAVASGLEAWPSAASPPPAVDPAAPTTEVQLRISGSPPQRLKLNHTHTVADLKSLVERALEAAGHAPHGYVLAAGFPPKPLTDDSATLESAGLLNASVIHRRA